MSSKVTEAEVRAEVREWLAANWDPDISLVAWRTKLADSGWGAPQWPTEWYGKGLPSSMVRVVEEEFAAVGAVSAARSGVRHLAAATLLEHGSDAQKKKYLRRILTGEDTWCQFFSEPGSGSDLAGATTRADLHGDFWIVNGQKVWTTSAHHADHGLLLARTDWDAPKHDGMSYFVIDVKQAGVDVQPLRQMNGHASFNQVFFTDAKVPAENLVGKVGDGWKVAMTTLAHERRGADGLATPNKKGVKQGKIHAEERAENDKANEPYRWYPQRAGRVDLILERAKETGTNKDPNARQEIAKLMILAKSAEWTARRARAAQQQGRPQGPEGSLGKLAASHVARGCARVHTIMTGTDAMLTGKESPREGIIAEILISVPAVSIAGGTDEIQRNIIAERVLGLPKEPRFDTGPFRNVRRN
jgi:alkylation response protein AidB-like acyl-CoA dehydrogenase